MTTALQKRLLETARHELGSAGEQVLRDAAEQICGAPLERISYAQLGQLLNGVERGAPAVVGTEPAEALARGIDGLRADADLAFRRRVVDALSEHLGPATVPFLTNTCAKLGLTADAIGRADRTQLAQGIRQEAGPFLGAEPAQKLALAVEQADDKQPPTLVPQLLALAVEHTGNDGEPILRALCRDRLEIELEDLDIDGLEPVARLLEHDGPPAVGAARTAAFIAAAGQALADPVDCVSSKVVELTSRYIGPAGRRFLQKVCAKNGIPVEALSREHVPWLADVLQSEAAPLAGARGAENLARDIRALDGASRR